MTLVVPNDLLASTKTDKMGNFELKGTKKEYMGIRPYIVIKHNCDVENKAVRLNLSPIIL